MTNAIFVYSQLDTLNTIPPPSPNRFNDIDRYTPTGTKIIPCWGLKSDNDLSSTLKEAARAYCDSFYN